MTDLSKHVIARTMLGRIKLSNEAKQAMRLVETLINEGLIELGNDPFYPGEQRFSTKKIRKPASDDVQSHLHAIDATTAQLRQEVEPVPAVAGMAMSIALDPLEQAIEATVRMMRDEREQGCQTRGVEVPSSSLYQRLGAHLEFLLDAQVKRVSI